MLFVPVPALHGSLPHDLIEQFEILAHRFFLSKVMLFPFPSNTLAPPERPGISRRRRTGPSTNGGIFLSPIAPPPSDHPIASPEDSGVIKT